MAPDRGERHALAPLVLATMTSQALLVVLSPTIVAIATEFGTSVAAVGQARSITAVVSVCASVAVMAKGDAFGLRSLISLGCLLAVAACGAVAAVPTAGWFLGMHVLVGLAFALLVSSGFAGIAGFPPGRRAWATGYVASANGLAWVVVNPLAGWATEEHSWRLAQLMPALLAVATMLAARQAGQVPARAVPAALTAPLAVTGARRWLGAETIGYAAWTALLTFAGAFFIEHLRQPAPVAGWLLAAAASAYLVAATQSGRLAGTLARRRQVQAASAVMVVLFPIMLSWGESLAVSAAGFGLLGLAAGIRTPASAGLGLGQLPDRPAAMSAARTAATQVGYLLGAVVGGGVIALWGYRALGWVLAGVMAVSALLLQRIDDTEVAADR